MQKGKGRIPQWEVGPQCWLPDSPAMPVLCRRKNLKALNFSPLHSYNPPISLPKINTAQIPIATFFLSQCGHVFMCSDREALMETRKNSDEIALIAPFVQPHQYSSQQWYFFAIVGKYISIMLVRRDLKQYGQIEGNATGIYALTQYIAIPWCLIILPQVLGDFHGTLS